ncbi:MAG: SusC/RagA family TonB-linked outer membrane protein [Longimicrobiales bacterium]
MRRTVATLLGVMAALFVAASPGLAQTGQIIGSVVDRQPGQALVGAQVYLEGTSFGSLTQENGRFTITNVPTGTYNVAVMLLGHASGRQENVRVTAGEATNLEFQLGITALKLEEVVVTGTADPIAGVKVPFTVGKVTKEDLPVPAITAETALRGKVAGVRVHKSGGQPGSGAEVLLRGATSIFRNNEPLYVVDGVILGSDLIDIDAQDIESIEVVKGASAASLYGSRASAGVIQIRTNRGRDITEGDTRIMLRSEYGVDQLNIKRDHITSHHHYRMNAAGTSYVDEDGNPVDKLDRVAEADQIADNPYPGPLYDHLGLFFDPGNFLTTSVSIAQNTRATNFLASFNYRDQQGVVPGNDGSSLYGVRVNLDHRLRDDLNFSVSSYYSKYYQEDFATDVFYDLMFMPPDVDLLTPNPDGEPYLIQPDPFTLQANPLYGIAFADNEDFRSRFTGNSTIRYSPANWFSLEGQLSYDRSDRHQDNYTPKGFKTLNNVSNGSVSRSNQLVEALNGSATASLLRSFGGLTTRTKVQYLFERETEDARSGAGNTLSVSDVPDIDVAVNESGGSGYEDIRSTGISAITGLDYNGKYIAEAMVRRDGSSLFGPDDRWHTYYRGSVAWRMSQEPWWFIPALNEFKLRYSIGTAGGRPEFGDRFETWSVSGGAVSKGSLGNKALRPEQSIEQEFGIDMILNSRHSLQLVYADQKTTDQLIQVPLPAVFGYNTQWQNAGTIESNTIEATLETMLVQRPDFQWSINVVADRTRSEITEFNRGCFGTVPYYCAGTQIGTIRGYRFLNAPNQVPASAAGHESEFQVNDDGLLVWVGAGNTFRDGSAKGLWGTNTTINGVTYRWGLPIIQRDAANVNELVEIGDINPDVNLGLGQNIQWKGFSLYALFDAKIGGDIYNNTRQWAYRDYNHSDYDQSGKPEELRKSVTYYQILYNTNANTSWFFEDAGYVKFRELSAQYSFNQDQLQSLFGGLGMQRLTVGLIGRNLLTWTDYTGFDPEVGNLFEGYDDFRYPNFRTFTGKVEIVF